MYAVIKTYDAKIKAVFCADSLHISRNTHSVTTALDRLRVVAISTTSGPELRIDRPISSSTYWSQVLRGRSGRRFQSVAGGVPVKASMDRCNACEAGVSLDNWQMWPKSEWRRSAMREGRSVSPVVFFIAVLAILSYHFTPRIWRWDCMWNDWTLSLSIFLMVHVSETYEKRKMNNNKATTDWAKITENGR